MASDSLDAATSRLSAAIADILTLVCEDIQGYPEAELRRRFVESAGADQMPDATLKALRTAARELGRASADDVRTRLHDPQQWRGEPDGEGLRAAGHLREVAGDEAKKDLSAVRPAWTVIAAIDARVEALAQQHGLTADDRVPKGYTPPKRFILGKHLPTLVEHFWKALDDVRRAEDSARQTDVESQKRRRAERWAAE
ncbi:MAG: hypothetical protein EXR79_07515 [Myxococcales bacterium]|nr:hypothetical protein [Myxococcales bacterium]